MLQQLLALLLLFVKVCVAHDTWQTTKLPGTLLVNTPDIRSTNLALTLRTILTNCWLLLLLLPLCIFCRTFTARSAGRTTPLPMLTS